MGGSSTGVPPTRPDRLRHRDVLKHNGQMRHTPAYLLADPDEVKRLIRENQWATIVSSTSNGIATGTVGLRLRVSRFDARLKLSQNRDPAVVERIVGHLEADGPYSSAPLAAEMRRAHAVAP